MLCNSNVAHATTVCRRISTKFSYQYRTRTHVTTATRHRHRATGFRFFLLFFEKKLCPTCVLQSCTQLEVKQAFLRFLNRRGDVDWRRSSRRRSRTVVAW